MSRQQRGFRGPRARGYGRGHTVRDSPPVVSEDSEQPVDVVEKHNPGQDKPSNKGGGGKKGGNFSGRGGPKNKKAPNPRNPSTGYSPFNNEPGASIDISGIAYCGKLQVGGEAFFTSSAFGVTDIIEVIFNQMVASDRWFSKGVSLSMFAYYCIELYWMKICEIELKNGTTDLDVRAMTENLASRDWIIPELFSCYLNSIGSIKDTAGTIVRHREIELPSAEVVDGLCGFFGRVGPDTHYHYENRPAPGVIAYRIGRDLLYTRDDVADAEWDLPAALAPIEEDAGLPTVNLLGWRPAVHLTPEQRNGLEQCGIHLDAHEALVFPRQYRFCYNSNLMVYVDRRINEVSSKLKCASGLMQTDKGSICQQDFQVTNLTANQDLGPTEMYGRHGVADCGMAVLDVRQDLLAQAFRLRMRRDPFFLIDDDIYEPYCCYRFEDYMEVPGAWTVTRNTYFDFGDRAAWNTLRFQSGLTDPNILLKLLMDKTLIAGVKVAEA